jgi:hypothetical protein
VLHDLRLVGQVFNLRADLQSAQAGAGYKTRAQDAILSHEANPLPPACTSFVTITELFVQRTTLLAEARLLSLLKRL